MSEMQDGGSPEHVSEAETKAEGAAPGKAMAEEAGIKLSPRMLAWLFPLLLAVLTFAAYWPVTRAGFIWDDDDYLVNHPIYTSPEAMREIWLVPRATPQFYPVVFTSFYIERKLWDLNPLGYHLFNVALHAGSAILLWRILKRLKVPGAEFAAAVFAVHPLMVETVAWVTERKNTYSMFFFLVALLTFWRFAFGKARAEGESMEGEPTRYEWGWYAVSLVAFVLAMLSKTVACSLGPVLVLLVWWKGPRLGRFLATIAYWVLGAAGGLYTAYLEVGQVGAQGKWWSLTFDERFLVASRAIWFYVGKLLLPIQLNFFYNRWTIDRTQGWQWLYVVGVGIALLVLFMVRKYAGWGPLVAAIAFIAMLFPALGFFPIYPQIFSWVADHFAYMGTLAFIPAVCAGLTVATRKWLPGMETVQVGIAAALVAVLAGATFFSAQRFESLETLWKSVLLTDPDHPHWNALSGMSGVYHRKAVAEMDVGNRDAAMVFNEQAKLFDEESLKVRPDYGLAYNNLAGYHMFRGEWDKALPLALKASELDPSDARIDLTIGHIYSHLGQPGKAAAAFERAVKIRPRMADYRVKMARALLAAGNEGLAKQYMQSALHLDAGNSDAHVLQGFLYNKAGDLPNALAEYRAALQSDPKNNEARDGFGEAVAYYPGTVPTEDLNEALDRMLEAVDATNGSNLQYVDTFGLLLYRAKRSEQAVTLLQRALQHVPPDQEAFAQDIVRHLKIMGVDATMPGTVPATIPATMGGHP
jgi:tetratricopeptide (TPR) repeat protein